MNIYKFKNTIKRRFYCMYIRQENGYYILHRSWGGLDNNLGHKKQEAFDAFTDCEKALKRYITTRVRRGYELLK